MKEFIGFVKGFAAAIWLVVGALLAIVGYACGMYTAVGLDTQKPKTPNYSKINRR